MQAAEEKRIWLIDIARFYAMSLVFFGHFIERIMMLDNPAGAVLYKFIYSFHMVLFVVLAGYVARESDVESGFGKYLKYRLLSRLLPFVFFTVIFMILPAFFSGEFFNLKLPSVEGYIGGLITTAFGLPMFCIPSWFILMIFTVEMIHFGMFRFIKSSNARILIAALAFYVLGYWLNLRFDIFNPMKGRIVGWNYLFIHEAITMYSFYLLGTWLKRNPQWMEKLPINASVFGVIVSFLIVLFTFNLNNGPFNFNYYNSVVILFSSHGSFIWFPIPALAGSLLVLFLAKCTPSQKTIVWLGQNTLLLIFLNGVFYHYINPRAAKWVLENFSPSFPIILAIGCAATVISLALCIPFVALFNTFVPQLVGKPKINGPWMQSFI
jgi:acyltransferase